MLAVQVEALQADLRTRAGQLEQQGREQAY